MTSPLTGLAATINNAFKEIFFDAKLIRDVVATGGDPADPPEPTKQEFPCKALRDTYSSFDRLNTEISTSDVKILILANSLSVTPVKNDIIIYEGISFSVIRADIDPANAVWICQASR